MSYFYDLSLDYSLENSFEEEQNFILTEYDLQMDINKISMLNKLKYIFNKLDENKNTNLTIEKIESYKQETLDIINTNDFRSYILIYGEFNIQIKKIANQINKYTNICNNLNNINKYGSKNNILKKYLSLV